MARIAEVYLSTLSAMMKPHGLDRNFTPFIYACRNSGKITQNDLAVLLHKDKVSTMRIVDHLSDLGYLVRKADKADRRCYILEVTPKAKKLLPKVEAGIRKTNEIILADLSASGRKELAKSMKKLMRAITQMPEPEFRIKAIKRKSST